MLIIVQLAHISIITNAWIVIINVIANVKLAKDLVHTA